MHLLTILLVLLLIAFPFGELLRFDIGNNVRFKPLDLIACLILVASFILLLAKRIQLPKHPWYYFAFPAISMISLLANSFWLTPTEIVASGLYLLRWVGYLSIVFVIVYLHKNFKRNLLSLLIIDGLIIVLLGFIQFFFFSDLKAFYFLGWDDHMYRLFSVFLDPNYTGGFFVLYLLFIGGLLYQLSKEKKRKNIQHAIGTYFPMTYEVLRLVLISILFLTVIATFLTFSRSTILMLIIGASVFFILIGRKKLILGLLGFIVLFTVLISSQFYIENVNLFRQASTNARISNYQDAITIISHNPVLGVGFNTYRYAKERYHITMDWMNTPSHADAGVDNSFLFILATTGFLGLGAYLVMWGFIVRRAVLLYKKEKNVFAIIVLASTAGLFVNAFFINSLFFPAIMVWMWIIIGLMEQR